ncbi:MAG: hypothetical protein PHR16_16165 [Methylovulum sp.]|nr:hypothetical protein [Methylovulum sp.]
MRTLIKSALGLAIFFLAVTANAEIPEPVNIPGEISRDILKRHPTAKDMQASYETHFGVNLLEVSFKDEADEKFLELFTAKGHLYVNEQLIGNLGEVSPLAIDALKKEFPKYDLNKAELIVNPNGVGEEYEVYLSAEGSDWKVSVNDKGVIQDKQQLAP